MLRSKLLLLTVIVSITLVSCKKESLVTNSVLPSPSDVRVKTKTEGNNVETYYYDSQNRVSKIVFSGNGTSYYYEYTYTNGVVSEYRSNEARHQQEETLPNGITKINCTSNPRIYRLSANGFYTGNSSVCEEQSYKYDANGFVINQNYTITDYKRTQQIANDGRNVTSINCKGYSYGGGEFAYSIVFQYLSDKHNTIGNVNFGKSFLGKSSENLVRSVNEDGKTTNYLYELDAQQRVVNVTATTPKSQTITSYTYY